MKTNTEINIKLNIVNLDETEKNLDRIGEKLEKANSLADELAEKDLDASIENLVDRLMEKRIELDEFEAARILTPLFRCGNGEMILKMISTYLRG